MPPLQIYVEKIKKSKKIENTKIKKKNYSGQLTTTSPVVSSYNFSDEICTLVSPGIWTVYLTSSLACTFFITTLHSYYLWLYGICYSSILILKLIYRGEWRHHRLKKYFSILPENSLNPLHIAKQIKKWNFNTIVIVNYRRKNIPNIFQCIWSLSLWKSQSMIWVIWDNI